MSTLRDGLILAALSIVAFKFDRRDRVRAEHADNGQNVILVVADGLRWQEVFRGSDPALLEKGARTMSREELMPFLWGTVARQGQIFGNRGIGSPVEVSNGLKFSYPGYNELLVGYPDQRINSNLVGPNPNVTVFEWLNTREGLRGRVGAIGAWETFADVFNHKRSGIVQFAGTREPLDANAQRAALRYLSTKHPRAMFVAFVETDDMAHKGKYSATLAAAHAIDGYLAQLWSAVQSDGRYRGKTTLIVTTDHGRGRGSEWTDHGPKVEGAEETWIAMIGPGVAALGERRNTTRIVNAQVAATVAAALGLDYARRVRSVRPAIGTATAHPNRSELDRKD